MTFQKKAIHYNITPRVRVRLWGPSRIGFSKKKKKIPLPAFDIRVALWAPPISVRASMAYGGPGEGYRAQVREICIILS